MQKTNSPLVAIHTLVYNHEPFLRDYFEGIIMQKTTFPFIAVVHDDFSTDNSASIIREYAEKYPDIIKPIFEDHNCYYTDWDNAYKKIFKAYNGAKYLAFCEGDDYWTDPEKLQRQVDFLENNPDYSAIAENGIVKYTYSKKEHPFNKERSHDVNIQEVIISRRFPTAGVVCRLDCFNDYRDTCTIHTDTIEWCWLLSKGKFRYDDTISSVYRRGPQGVTISTEPYVFAKTIEKWNMEILRVFNVKKDFIYLHIAKIYKSFIGQSIHSHHYMSAIKGCYRCGLFLLKTIGAKLGFRK